jgi:hypothetical protein
MKRKPVLIFLVILISVFIVVWPAYFQYSNLKRAKLLSTDLGFESLDEENMSIDRQKQSKVFVSRSFSNLSHLGTNVFEDISCFSYPTFSLNQTSTILRC